MFCISAIEIPLVSGMMKKVKIIPMKLAKENIQMDHPFPYFEKKIGFKIIFRAYL
jgi:hypothetical protein